MTHKALIKRLETTCFGLDPIDPLRLLVDDVIAALAQPEQEPVAYWKEHAQGLQRDYDSLLADFEAQRTWVGLTDEEKSELWEISRAAWPRYVTYASLAEAKLKQKNT